MTSVQRLLWSTLFCLCLRSVAGVYLLTTNKITSLAVAKRPRDCCVGQFWPNWGLGATYTDHLRLIEKITVDFLFVLIELFRQVNIEEVF